MDIGFHQSDVSETQRLVPNILKSRRPLTFRLHMYWTLLISVVALFASPSFAQDAYPAKPIRIIVPTAPGGPSDLGSRMIGDELQKRWGKPVVVETRPGAGTIVGTEIVAKAAPDGYTLLMSPSTLATNPASYKKMPYDALRDFAPITQTLSVPNLVVIHPSLPAKSLKEFIALAKSKPGDILYASAGHGTNPHLTIELLASMAQIRLYHVPYKGSLPGIVDLLAGRVALTATSSMANLIPHVKSGRMRALGVTTLRRIDALPDVPTIAEAGVPGYESVQWSGLLAPAGTPREIIAMLHKEAAAIVRSPEGRARLAALGSEVVASTPEEFAAFIKSETIKWARVAKAAGITPE
jgi:tripartite-type tricarboxylate transporter receptor subunit TctC